LLVVLDAAFPHYVFSALEELALFCTAVFTSLSGIAYIRLGIRLAQETGRIQS
jgi:hypothetical protein